MNLIFRPLGKPELNELRSWFADPELGRRIDYPRDEWFAYVTQTPGVFAWMIFDAEMPVGMSQVDLAPDNLAYVDLAVKPGLRGQGYGRRILQQLVDQPELKNVTTFAGQIEPDNLSSRHAVLAAGWQIPSETPDADGMIEYIYTRQ